MKCGLEECELKVAPSTRRKRKFCCDRHKWLAFYRERPKEKLNKQQLAKKASRRKERETRQKQVQRSLQSWVAVPKLKDGMTVVSSKGLKNPKFLVEFRGRKKIEYMSDLEGLNEREARKYGMAAETD